MGVAGESIESTSWALFILTSLLLVALWMSYYMQLKRVKAVHETVLSIFLGICQFMCKREIDESRYGGRAGDSCSAEQSDPEHGYVPPCILFQYAAAAYYFEFGI